MSSLHVALAISSLFIARSSFDITTYNQMLGTIVGTMKIELSEDERRLDHYKNYDAFISNLNSHLLLEVPRNDKGQYLDRWGNPIVLLFESGVAVGAGSCGENQQWDHGLKDDIVLYIDNESSLSRLYPQYSPLMKWLIPFVAGAIACLLIKWVFHLLKHPCRSAH